jgi:hypothetical protein
LIISEQAPSFVSPKTVTATSPRLQSSCCAAAALTVKAALLV